MTTDGPAVRALRRQLAGVFKIRRREAVRALVMAGLFFLVICTFGVLKPIKNAFALDGLAGSEFYKVYLVSAVVVLFVVPYNRLADRVPWRHLIPGVAAFFALNLLIFWLFYREGSTAFGFAFYGWYDLYSAVMVTQFFTATQLLLNARDAKRLYPFAIAGGSLGGVVGAGITGFFAENVGSPNLLLVAAGLVVLFALAVPLVWAAEAPAEGTPGIAERQSRYTAGDLTSILRNKHVLLIAASVLLTVLVKQLIDYQFNEISKEVFVDRDAIGAFQGKFFAITQWLPLLALLALRPLLRRWGVGLVVLLLPVLLLATNLALALTWGLAWAVVGKAGDNAFRYTAERASREILYVPLPHTLKLKAKAYIDLALEKGLAKVMAAGLIFGVIGLIDYRKVGYVGAALGAIWLAVALAVRSEYVRSLAQSIRGRFASFEGIFASMADATTVPAIRQTLEAGDDRGIAFALDLIDQADPASARPLLNELHELLDHDSPRIREGALNALTGFSDGVDWVKVREKLEDPDPGVRNAAVKTLCQSAGEPEAVMRGLLNSDVPAVRIAALGCLVEDRPMENGLEAVDPDYLDRHWQDARSGDREARLELALALGALGERPRVPELLDRLLVDPDPEVARAAIRSAGHLGRHEHLPRIITALGSSQTREAARDALISGGTENAATLSSYLSDESVDLSVRRNIPSVLARIRSQPVVDRLLRFLLTAPSDRLLRYRALKALNKLRDRAPDLQFDRATVLRALDQELEAARRYARGVAALDERDDGPAVQLLRQSLDEAWGAGRERVFRYLGLVYPPDGMYHAYLTLQNSGPAARANALEWLEETLGHGLFSRLQPAIQRDRGAQPPGRSLRPLLTELVSGDDSWLALAAVWSTVELQEPWVREELERARGSSSAEVSHLAERALAELDSGYVRMHEWSGEMNLIEKVFLLQQVDLLQDARAEDLAVLASIAEEIAVKPGTVLLRQDEPTQALYVVIRGAVELRRASERVLTAQDGTPFGTWALIDEAPSLVGATAVEETELLRITREDFYDLLAEHSELVRDLLRGLARRVRALVA